MTCGVSILRVPTVRDKQIVHCNRASRGYNTVTEPRRTREITNVATKNLSANAPNQNYTDGANYVGGVAPTTGDTVIIAVAPPNGPITATNLAITGETINLVNGGQFFAVGVSSFDAATTLNDGNGATNNDIQLADFFTNAGTIVNPDYITVVNTSANGAEDPLLTNSGTLSYTTNVGGTGLSPYVLNAYNSVRPATVGFNNTGVINVLDAAGANEGVSPPVLDTQVQITGVSTGTGTVNVTGSARIRLAPSRARHPPRPCWNTSRPSRGRRPST